MRLAELRPPGTRVITGTLLFTAEDIVRYAKKFDPQPFHVDAEAAKNYVFGALCASGWHTCAGWMKTYIAYWKAEVARLESEGITAPKLGPSAGFRKLQWLEAGLCRRQRHLFGYANRKPVARLASRHVHQHDRL